MAIASVSYPAGVSEFEKSGLTPIPSEVVKPYRLKESPVQFECKVKEIVTLGEHGGAGHLIICDVLRIHIAENVIDEKGRIDPHKLDLVGRLGRAYYVRASGSALFTLHQDQEVIPIGFDALPLAIRQSKVLTGNDLGQLAGLLAFPTAEAIAAAKAAVTGLSEEALHQKAQALLAEERAEEALALLMAAGV
jgi:hypothetical protein